VTRTLGGIVQLNHPNFDYSLDAALVTALAREAPLLLEIANQGFQQRSAGRPPPFDRSDLGRRAFGRRRRVRNGDRRRAPLQRCAGGAGAGRTGLCRRSWLRDGARSEGSCHHPPSSGKGRLLRLDRCPPETTRSKCRHAGHRSGGARTRLPSIHVHRKGRPHSRAHGRPACRLSSRRCRWRQRARRRHR
jgi:hypothetical protein